MKKLISIMLACLMSISMVGNISVYAEDWYFFDKETITNVLVRAPYRRISNRQFMNCPRLERVKYEWEWTNHVYQIDGELFYESQYNLLNVWSIGESAFYNCPGLKRIDVPEPATVGNMAFGYFEGEDGSVKQMEDFLIRGFIGSDAERYARENNFRFQPYRWYTMAGEYGGKLYQRAVECNSQPILIPGDINSDNVVSIEDVQQALIEYVTNLSNGTKGNVTVVTDVSGDNVYDIEDIQLILKYYTINLSSTEWVSWYDIKSR